MRFTFLLFAIWWFQTGSLHTENCLRCVCVLCLLLVYSLFSFLYLQKIIKIILWRVRRCSEKNNIFYRFDNFQWGDIFVVLETIYFYVTLICVCGFKAFTLNNFTLQVSNPVVAMNWWSKCVATPNNSHQFAPARLCLYFEKGHQQQLNE